MNIANAKISFDVSSSSAGISFSAADEPGHLVLFPRRPESRPYSRLLDLENNSAALAGLVNVSAGLDLQFLGPNSTIALLPEKSQRDELKEVAKSLYLKLMDCSKELESDTRFLIQENLWDLY